MLLFCFVFSNEKKWTVGFMGQSICTIGHHHIRGQTHSFKSYYSGRWSTVLFHSYDSIGWMWPLLHINETCHPCKHKQITYCSSSCSINITWFYHHFSAAILLDMTILIQSRVKEKGKSNDSYKIQRVECVFFLYRKLPLKQLQLLLLLIQKERWELLEPWN